MSEANMDTVNQIYTAFGAGNISALLDLFEPSIEWLKRHQGRIRSNGYATRAGRPSKTPALHGSSVKQLQSLPRNPCPERVLLE